MKYIVSHYICQADGGYSRVTCYDRACNLCKHGKYPKDEDIEIGINAEIMDLTPEQVYNYINNANNVVIKPFNE